MPIIQINADLTTANKLLTRIANVLERWLLAEHGLALGHCAEPAVDPNPKEKATVAYHTDEDTIREELKSLAGWRERGDGDDEIEEEEHFGV